MDLEKNVPVLVVATVLIETIPPEPVAAFSDVQRFPRSFETGVVWIVCFESDQLLTCFNKTLPSKRFLLFTSPGTQRSVNP